MRLSLVFLLVYLTNVSVLEGYTPVSRGCSERSCYPATGNLLIGRQDKLSATSTCGSSRRERYCILSHLDATQRDQKCFWCDSTDDGLQQNPKMSHRVENIVYRWEPPGEPRSKQHRSWWQAENGKENVSIQLDLEAEFHVTHLIITFKTFRPAAMYIEKSYDWGQTWKIHRYFAYDCAEAFPGVHQGAPRYLNETVCQKRYSKIVPSTLGSVIYRVMPPNININSPGFYPYSKEVQDLLKTTNLRIHMTKLHTMGDENLKTNRRDIKEKYYYAIYDMTIRGSCSCYGHAERCLPEKEEHKDIEAMVHGKCDCTHNTMGNNCEYCLPDHNDVPWNPATGKKKNECKKCTCNDHATSCFFNPLVFAATGNVSGGVCENCTHNTEGRQCEFCKLGFYQDPELSLNDPEICKPCDCEPSGTIDDGLCDSRTDEEEELIAGQCHCKRNVGGDRCDRCINGFWNFTEANLDGCQECTCDIRGIVSDQGCNQESGDCTCKRFVIGRDCNQCMDEHYDLSADDPNGCKPCECDVGGAYDNKCDVSTGQCMCRPNVVGRRCNEVKDGYFSGALDYLLFEGELARGSQNPPTTVIRREPSSMPGGTTWTGFGFMQVYEGSNLTFDVPAIFKDLDYDLVVRHEHTQNYPDLWQNVTVELIHLDGPPKKKGVIAKEETVECDREVCESDTENEVGGDDGTEERGEKGTLQVAGIFVDSPIAFSMSPNDLHSVIAPKLSLEEGKRYQLKFSFDQQDLSSPNPKASILIDSITLVPTLDSMEIFDGSDASNRIKDTLETLGCRERFLSAKRPEDIPEDCKEPLKSVSMYTYEGGFSKRCECDNTGSESSLCDKYTGQCPCKKNVYGRRCSRCAPGHYSFGADGCLPCNCHNLGSLDPFCRETDGQCNCAENAYGRRCNECQPGYWNFPDCKVCECNGHADTCDASTGECQNCRSATTGFHCDICLDGYYGDPSLEANIPCRECPCPNTKASGHSFADTCYLDNATNEPVCECEPEYKGSRCSMCADNFYGNPELPGGSCMSCNCSDNWNYNDTGNCDPSTGECLKCLFNTEGTHCEFCKAGFFGNAVEEVCQQCMCNLLGTDPNMFDCNRFTGVCNCLPNVEGEHCDRCVKDHWKLASGRGCEACDCDSVGSQSATCNLYTGQCQCKEGFGGRKCDQCTQNYYGDPKTDSCFPCNCNPQGSQSFQCDHITGKCVCLEGIGGEKCDQCARGFVQGAELTAEHPVLNRTIPYGELPQCAACGECFTNWDRILNELRNQTDAQIARAEHVKVTGATGAYTSAFKQMETKLIEIQEILDAASVSNNELVDIQKDIDKLSSDLKTTARMLDDLDSSQADTKQSIMQAQSNLEYLKLDSDRLKLDAQEMKDEITALQETNVEGALNLTREARRRSDEAALKVENIRATGGFLKNSESQRRATDTLMNNSRLQFSQTQEQNQDTLTKVVAQIDSLEGKIPDLNKQVCDGETSIQDSCDELCGGAGCGKCGGLSCLNGALSKAKEAIKAAETSDEMLVNKDSKAESVLRNIMKVQQEAKEATRIAQDAYDKANEAKNNSVREMSRVSELTKRMYEFTSSDQASPEKVKILHEECMSATMDLDAGEIEELARQIEDAMNDVINVDEILTDTADDVQKADDLKESAERVQQEAKKQLDHAEKVTKDLSQALEAQNKADISIQSTQTDIDSSRKDLGQIENDMKQAINEADSSVVDVTQLVTRQQTLQTEYIKSANRVQSAELAAEDAKEQAQNANSDLYELNIGYKNISGSLEAKTSSIGTAKDVAMDLQRRANNLANSASNKLSNLLDIEKEFEENERKLMELSSELVTLNCEMKIQLDIIEDKSNYYRTCSPPDTWTARANCQCTPGSPEPACTARREVYGADYIL